LCQLLNAEDLVRDDVSLQDGAQQVVHARRVKEVVVGLVTDSPQISPGSVTRGKERQGLTLVEAFGQPPLTPQLVRGPKM